MDTTRPAQTQDYTEVVIRGVTSQGRAFRPSDWADRLAGLASHVGIDNRLNYCPCVQPITRDGVRCVVINRSLERQDADLYRFLLGFARDNDLDVMEGRLRLRGD